MNNYIDTIYNEKVRPVTNYPALLADYLQEKYYIHHGSKILIVGCGRGDVARAFMAKGMNVHCIDKVKTKLHEGLQIKYLDISNKKFPYLDNTFDFVFSKSVIEHLHDPDNMIKESYRVLRYDKRVIIMTPDWNSQMTTFYDDHTHVQPYTVISMNDLLKMYSFRRVCSVLFYQLPVIWKYPLLKVIGWLLRKFIKPSSEIKNKFIRWSLELMVLAVGVK